MSEQPLIAHAIAERLELAWRSGRPIEPLSQTDALRDIGDAYAVAQAWRTVRLHAGETIVGRKIGLTSQAVQEQFGVSVPDFGDLYASRQVTAVAGRATVEIDTFIQPRLEGELAFLIGTDLSGPDVTPQRVLASTECVAPAFEIVDSRIRDWQITITDTVADNASFGAFVVGPWSHSLSCEDLRLTGMLVSRNAIAATQGLGAAALGHPARAVAWLANTLSRFGEGLKAGDIVMSGALARMLPVERGDLFTLEVQGQPPLSLLFC